MLAVAALVVALAVASPVLAQQVTFDLGSDSSLAARSIQLITLVTLLSLAPGLAIMVTCFPFVVTVLSILRQAIGLQQSPPNMVIVSLSLFITWFVMDPVFTRAWHDGIEPLMAGSIPIETAVPAVVSPFRGFMALRVDLQTFETLRDLRPAQGTAAMADAPLSLLVPSFMLSEIQGAFEIGFLIYLPFLIIDLVVAAVLMSMGMMMVPPAAVSMPFKLAFFVIADGWSLVSSALVRGYG
ncbi:flagellar type III secretion system pore protein FliP [Tabrizicola sp. J26]|uniref:flagellar type III secretion system pore protein FliP n=1 Tax=Alitabrizicola rongguiensis TaxID=2909234 RepID=UPI001EECC37A|nr:flagellar type III secretion system pore protein FliP [Tabrizicola rongguiensis]MCF1710637.1 flagellar type III secretion system pore protein FliP [Tabrizicola rongguiensis]